MVSPASTISHVVYIVDALSAGPALVQGTAEALRMDALKWANISDVSALWYPPSHRLWYAMAAAAGYDALPL